MIVNITQNIALQGNMSSSICRGFCSYQLHHTAYYYMFKHVIAFLVLLIFQERFFKKSLMSLCALFRLKVELCHAKTCTADLRLCFRYADCTLYLLPKTNASLKQFPVPVQPCLCLTWSETPKLSLSRRGSFISSVSVSSYIVVSIF